MKLYNMPTDAERLQFLRDAYDRTNELIKEQAETILKLQEELQGFKNSYRVACKEIDERQAEVKRLREALEGFVNYRPSRNFIRRDNEEQELKEAARAALNRSQP